MNEQSADIGSLLSLHTFSLEGRWYAIDGASGDSFVLDERAAYAIERLHRAPGEARLPTDMDPTLARSLRALARSAADSLRAEERLRSATADVGPPAQVELCLCATFRCNLACRYCFVRLVHSDRQDSRGDMSLATAKAATDLFLASADPLTETLSVTVGHTGEPMLVRELYEQLRGYLRQRSAETGREIPCNTSATNFTLVKWPDLPRMSWLSISLDGPASVHDQVRVTPDGRGTYALAASGVEEAMASAWFEPGEVQASATITAQSTDIRGIFLHLVSLGGPRVSLYPVRLPPASPLAISESAAGKILAGYDELVSYLLALEHGVVEYYLRRLLDKADYFGRLVLRVVTGERVARRCGAGIGMYAVMPSGEVFPCPELGILGRMRLGSVQTGIDAEALSAVQKRRTWDTTACATCWARRLCGGDCLSNSAMYEPFGTPPDPGMCALNRGLAERAVHLVAKLRQERAGVLAALSALHAG